MDGDAAAVTTVVVDLEDADEAETSSGRSLSESRPAPPSPTLPEHSPLGALVDGPSAIAERLCRTSMGEDYRVTPEQLLRAKRTLLQDGAEDLRVSWRVLVREASGAWFAGVAVSYNVLMDDAQVFVPDEETCRWSGVVPCTPASIRLLADAERSPASRTVFSFLVAASAVDVAWRVRHRGAAKRVRRYYPLGNVVDAAEGEGDAEWRWTALADDVVLCGIEETNNSADAKRAYRELLQDSGSFRLTLDGDAARHLPLVQSRSRRGSGASRATSQTASARSFESDDAGSSTPQDLFAAREDMLREVAEVPLILEGLMETALEERSEGYRSLEEAHESILKALCFADFDAAVALIDEQNNDERYQWTRKQIKGRQASAVGAIRAMMQQLSDIEASAAVLREPLLRQLAHSGILGNQS